RCPLGYSGPGTTEPDRSRTIPARVSRRELTNHTRFTSHKEMTHAEIPIHSSSRRHAGHVRRRRGKHGSRPGLHATNHGRAGPGTIEVHARLCDETPADGDWFTNCHESPLAEQVITAYNTQDGSTFDGTTDANGNVVLGVPPGEYELTGIPGDFLENSFIYCSTSDAGEEALYPVIIEAEQPSVICDFYMVPADLSGGIDINVHVNLCIAPGCTEL